MPYPYNGTNDLFNVNREFARPIDLSGGGLCQVPPLQESALLQLSGEPVLVMPEVKCVAPTLQDYKIVALNAVLGRSQARHTREDVIRDLRRLDFTDGLPEWGGLPLGIMIVRNGEEVNIGRTSTPRLHLGGDVASSHAIIGVSNAGLTIEDASMHNPLSLRLAHSDSILPLSPPVQEKVGAKTRDDIFSTYARLCSDGGFEMIDDNLRIKGMLCSEDGIDRLELFVKRAAQYPSLSPSSDFDELKVTVDASKEGAETCYLAKSISREPGITLLDVEGQLTARQAHDLLLIGLEVSLSR